MWSFKNLLNYKARKAEIYKKASLLGADLIL
jgi:hypothetical protein